MKLFYIFCVLCIPFILIQADAACGSLPCFDAFVASNEEITEKYIQSFMFHSINANFEEWSVTERNWANTDDGLENDDIICTAFDSKGQTYYRMLMFKDNFTISSLENHRDDSMCKKWLPAKNADHNPGPVEIPSPVETRDEKKLRLTLESCECQADESRDCFSYGASWENSTHMIDNHDCAWVEKRIAVESAYQNTTTTPTRLSTDTHIESGELVRAGCESDTVEVVDGICQPIKTCEVIHIPFINYALDSCNHNIIHLQLLLIISIATIPTVIIIVSKYKGKF